MQLHVLEVGVGCHQLTSTLKAPIWNPVKPSLTVSTSPPVEATIGTCSKVVQFCKLNVSSIIKNTIKSEPSDKYWAYKKEV